MLAEVWPLTLHIDSAEITPNTDPAHCTMARLCRLHNIVTYTEWGWSMTCGINSLTATGQEAVIIPGELTCYHRRSDRMVKGHKIHNDTTVHVRIKFNPLSTSLLLEETHKHKNFISGWNKHTLMPHWSNFSLNILRPLKSLYVPCLSWTQWISMNHFWY